MKLKLFYITILTVFLVGTVCFLPKTVVAKQNNVQITFCCQGETFVYDQSKITFDKNSQTLSALQRRGFFDDNKTIAKIASILVLMGALNWGLIGFFGYDLFASIFAGQALIFSWIFPP